MLTCGDDFTSICGCRNSGEMRPAVAAPAASKKARGTAWAMRRVCASTRKYSSSIPIGKAWSIRDLASARRDGSCLVMSTAPFAKAVNAHTGGKSEAEGRLYNACSGNRVPRGKFSILSVACSAQRSIIDASGWSAHADNARSPSRKLRRCPRRAARACRQARYRPGTAAGGPCACPCSCRGTRTCLRAARAARHRRARRH